MLDVRCDCSERLLASRVFDAGRGATWAAGRWRAALTNLGRRKPRGSWIRLWGKRADGRDDDRVRVAADGERGA